MESNQLNELVQVLQSTNLARREARLRALNAVSR